MKTFDLEQQIMQCWDVVTDLELIQGETTNALRHIYQLKFEKLFQTFEEVCADYHASRREVEQKPAEEKGKPYFPGNWAVVRMSSGVFKLLVGWEESGDTWDSWNAYGWLNSGIVRVEKDGDAFIFHGVSGSQYCVFPQHYGLRPIAREFYDSLQGQVDLLPADTNWLEMDWNAHVGQPWLRTYDGTQE